jgi:hypothetical protein
MPVIDLCSSDEEELAPPTFKQKKEAKAKKQEPSKHQLTNWCFTLYPDAYENKRAARADVAAMGEEAKYLVAGREVCPSTKRKHYQGFVIFKERVRFTALKKKYDPSIHWEPTKGTVQQNFEYCTKEDNDPIVYGERPEFESAGEREKARWSEARKAASEGRLDDVDDQIFVCHYGNIRKIASDLTKSTTWLEELDHFWLWGVPGSGKSHKARTHWTEEFGEPFLKGLNKWWDGYKDHRLVVLEDIDTSHAWMAQLLKVWSDKYPYPAEVKGSVLGSIRPAKLVVTSNYSIDDIFDPVDAMALKRRFNIQHFPFRYGESSGPCPPVTPERGENQVTFVEQTPDAVSITVPRLPIVKKMKKTKSKPREDSDEEDETQEL